MDHSSLVPVSPERAEHFNDSLIEDDAWSRHVETDASERGRLSTTTSLVMEGDHDDSSSSNHPPGEDMMDDWSRQVVGTDETIHRTPSSVLDDDGEHAASVAVAASAATTGSVTTVAVDEGLAVAPPHREEPTLKEKLVERERQRRVETERARLKRQFALRNGHEESLVEEDEDHEGDEDHNSMRENGSVAGTVGEGSIVGPVDVLLEDDQHKQMNYPMERFLQEQGTIMEEDTVRDPITSSKRDTQNQGVVMERFLQEPVVVEPASSHEASIDHRPSNVDRSVSFDMDPPHSPRPDSPRLGQSSVGGESIPEQVATPSRSVSRKDFDDTPGDDYNGDTSTGINTPRDGASYLASASMDCVTSEVTRISDLGPPPDMPTPELTVDGDHIQPSPMEQTVDILPPESPTIDQPRVLGLTQAEIEELEAIEEVSQQNAPPSERDDLSASSFVAELVSDFGGPGIDHTGGTTLSQGTPTTAMESASILSGNHSAQPTVSENADDRRSIDELENASVTSNLGASSDGGGVSVTANPPSELGHEDTLLSPLADAPSSNADAHDPALQMGPSIPYIDEGPDDLSDLATLNAGIVNRQIRPGMISAQQAAQFRRDARSSKSPVRRVMSMPDKLLDFDVEGFDYDKDAPVSPSTSQFARIQDASPDRLWSPGSRLSMEPSPFRPRTVDELPPRTRSPPNYGTASNVARKSNGLNQHEMRLQEQLSSEAEPLMPDIPSEIVTNSRASTTKANLKEAPSVSATEAPKQDTREKYMQSSLLYRAFPERILALAATFLVEVPVVLMIAGGSDRLCSLLGRSTYYMLMALLPLCSAISGNVGLQTSTLTAHGISNGQITRKNCMPWLLQEIGTAAYLGLVTGTLLGLVAFTMSGFNALFGFSIMIAQGISMIAAGLSGALPPLFFGFFFELSAEKWKGLIETALQDVISTFVMVVLAYKMLEYCGPFQIDPSDTCYAQAS